MRGNRAGAGLPLRLLTDAAGVLALIVVATAPAYSQGAPQTVGVGSGSLATVDPKSVATGYRTSKVIGAVVVNETNETIGKIDDLIVTPNERVPFAILSVGGFLGLGVKLVVVSFGELKPGDRHMVLPGATRASLRALPDFHYAN